MLSFALHFVSSGLVVHRFLEILFAEFFVLHFNYETDEFHSY